MKETNLDLSNANLDKSPVIAGGHVDNLSYIEHFHIYSRDGQHDKHLLMYVSMDESIADITGPIMEHLDIEEYNCFHHMPLPIQEKMPTEKQIQSSECFIAIIGGMYGVNFDEKQISKQHYEYQVAYRHWKDKSYKRVCIFRPDDQIDLQQDLRQKASRWLKNHYYYTPEEIIADGKRLEDFIMEIGRDSRGWKSAHTLHLMRPYDKDITLLNLITATYKRWNASSNDLISGKKQLVVTGLKEIPNERLVQIQPDAYHELEALRKQIEGNRDVPMMLAMLSGEKYACFDEWIDVLGRVGKLNPLEDTHFENDNHMDSEVCFFDDDGEDDDFILPGRDLTRSVLPSKCNGEQFINWFKVQLGLPDEVRDIETLAHLVAKRLNGGNENINFLIDMVEHYGTGNFANFLTEIWGPFYRGLKEKYEPGQHKLIGILVNRSLHPDDVQSIIEQHQAATPYHENIFMLPALRAITDGELFDWLSTIMPDARAHDVKSIMENVLNGEKQAPQQKVFQRLRNEEIWSPMSEQRATLQ